MSFLTLVLSAKIIVTLIFLALPFLFMPAKYLENWTGVSGGETFFRLYGVAIFALLIGYASGFWVISKGEFPWGVVAMGTFSNAGGSIVMLVSGAWKKAKLLTFFITCIALLLIISAVLHEKALQQLF